MIVKDLILELSRWEGNSEVLLHVDEAGHKDFVVKGTEFRPFDLWDDDMKRRDGLAIVLMGGRKATR